MRTVVSVTVETDQRWPTDKEIDNRNAAIQELSDRNLGKFLWAGKGIGCMDFAFEVHNVQVTKTQLAKAMLKHLPGWKYSVTSIPSQLVNTFRLTSKHGIHAGESIVKAQSEMTQSSRANHVKQGVSRGFEMGM